MRVEEFKKWLEERGLQKRGIESRISNCRNVEKHYPDLDTQFRKDKGLSLMSLLTYSMSDQRNELPPKHDIPIEGKIREGSSTLKQAVGLYMKFCDSEYEQRAVSSLLINDLEEIDTNDNLTEDQKRVLVKYRIGQSEFRKKLKEYWGGCSVNGCKNVDVLIASHIKPYSLCENEEKYDPFNGLLLTPNYDKLFDSYLITFDEVGQIIISKSVSAEDLNRLNISKSDFLNPDKFTINHALYMEEHRKCFYENEEN